LCHILRSYLVEPVCWVCVHSFHAVSIKLPTNPLQVGQENTCLAFLCPTNMIYFLHTHFTSQSWAADKKVKYVCKWFQLCYCMRKWKTFCVKCNNIVDFVNAFLPLSLSLPYTKMHLSQNGISSIIFCLLVWKLACNPIEGPFHAVNKCCRRQFSHIL